MSEDPESFGEPTDGNEILIVAIDLTPVWWGTYAHERLILPDFIETILAFVNLHLMLSPLNEVAIIGITPEKTEFLWPLSVLSQRTEESSTHDGQYEALAIIGENVRKKTFDLISSCESLDVTVSFSGAIIKALCYFMRRCRELRPTMSLPIAETFDETARTNARDNELLRTNINGRILIIRAAEDAAAQYLPLMNAVFTAQKLRVPIDACIIPPTTSDALSENRHTSFVRDTNYSSLFHQAADLTGGIYLRVPRPAALLQYLVSVFLPRVSLRSQLIIPNQGPSQGVDFRAACFCHKKLVDLAYVCSVCLSVFCCFSPICSTCHTPFKIPQSIQK